ncbi:MAG: hypothetical protein H8E79_06415 [Desulfobulbaceae bacterium]|uniref:RapZ C-terminal domain-containing protein n=1 Tax=Candidatus Desulfatifera sulfidica TaxID=2841691 RepID=A0A8J6N8E4_9BACT|nr:hypothetical protein [Candidatus Desulfatifera sulfidica]
MPEKSIPRLQLTLLSFGFKYNEPPAASLVFDVRFLPNPYWIETLRPYSGLEPAIADYVLRAPESNRFLELLDPLLLHIIAEHDSQHKKELCLAVGCTGGRHRSVAVIEALKQRLIHLPVDLSVSHRDIDREE